MSARFTEVTADDSAEMWDAVRAEMEASGLVVREHHDLSAQTTYGVGGPARLGVHVDGLDDALAVATVLSRHPEVPCLVVGRGSNLLVSDGGFAGVAVLTVGTRSGDEIAVDGELVVASGSISMPVLARRSGAMGRTGLEWAVGIPGALGGAVRMNAGCHGGDMAGTLEDVDVVSFRSGRCERVAVGTLGLHFRGSALLAHHMVVSARLCSQPGEAAKSAAEMARIVAWRRENQPGGRNAGSVFVNPSDGATAAGALIEQCGLRGVRVGAAEISAKHANFIQAHDGATADDIVAAMVLVQERVEQQHGIRLSSEIRLVGFGSEIEQRFADQRHGSRALVEDSGRLCALLGETRASR